MADFNEDNLDKPYGEGNHYGGVTVDIDECRETLVQEEIDFEELISMTRSYNRNAIVEGSLVYLDEREGGWLNNNIEQLHVIEELGHGTRMEERFYEARPVFGDYLLVSHGPHDKVYKVPPNTELTCVKGDVKDEDVHQIGELVRCKEIPDEWMVEKFNLESELVSVTI